MTSFVSDLVERAALAADTVLDRTVAPGFSAVGFGMRRMLPTWPSDVPSAALRGRTAIVTGASSGLGIETAAGLGRLGAQVHLVVRDTGKGERVAQRLRAELGADAGCTVWACDISDLDSVRDLAARLGAALPRIDVLVHNAGALPATRQDSAQGHELTMALHLLGPMLMTDLLVPQLAAARGTGPAGPGARARRARVIFVTSGGMYTQRLHVDDPEYRDGDYSGAVAYARSKRAQVELLPLLQQRWGPHGIDVHATHPGWADTPGVSESLPAFRRVTAPFLRSVHAGADTTIWLAATQPTPAGGGLWHDRRRRPTHVLPGTATGEVELAAYWAWAANAACLSELPTVPDLPARPDRPDRPDRSGHPYHPGRAH